MSFLTKNIKKNSDSALSLFKKAVTQLKEINNTANSAIIVNEGTINSLTVENSDLTSQVNANKKVIENIETLLGV